MRWGPQLTAVGVTAHLALITFMALPSPGAGLNRKAWSNPTVQAEFAAWTARLQGVGWQGDQAAFEDQLWVVAKGTDQVRDAVLGPAEPYLELSGAWQSWKMFVAPHRYPSRLHVELRREGDEDWTLVYAPHDAEHRWLAETLEHGRMRSAVFRYAWPNYRNSFGWFAKWVARRAVEDHPDATKVRVRFVTQRTPSPEEVLAGVVPKSKPGPSKVFSAEALAEGGP